MNNFEITDVDVSSITVLSIFMFGPNVGFVNFNVDSVLKHSKKRLPGK